MELQPNSEKVISVKLPGDISITEDFETFLSKTNDMKNVQVGSPSL